LESVESFEVAAEVSGEIERISVDIGDEVERGAVLVELNDEEFQQNLAQAKAELKVAEANLTRARNDLEIAQREFERIETLQERGVSSEAEFDRARAELLSQTAMLEVAEAQLIRQEAAVESAQIRLNYTRVRAEWDAEGDGNGRYVGTRYVDEGQIVSANEALLSIVQIQPITGVFFVTERDYSRMRTGQEVRVTTDAYPGRQFTGAVNRIAPVFDERSRQARIEVELPNQAQELKPGMFIRVEVTLESMEAASVVPYAALTRRDEVDGVFLLEEARGAVRWQPVEILIREGESVAVRGLPETGEVVVLGQQMLDDGSAITIPSENAGGEGGS
jgi:RND family efflux transporter MFP subunit